MDQNRGRDLCASAHSGLSTLFSAVIRNEPRITFNLLLIQPKWNLGGKDRNTKAKILPGKTTKSSGRHSTNFLFS